MAGIEPERPLQFGDGCGKIFRRQKGAAQRHQRCRQAGIEAHGFARFGQCAFHIARRDQRRHQCDTRQRPAAARRQQRAQIPRRLMRLKLRTGSRRLRRWD